MKVLFTVLALGAAAAGCAPMEGPVDTGSRNVAACLRSQDVDNFRVASDSQAWVHSRRGGAFRLDAAPNCFDASTRGVLVTPYVATSPDMCAGDRVRVEVQMTSAVPRTCIATISGPETDGNVSRLPG